MPGLVVALFFAPCGAPLDLPSFPTRRSSDLARGPGPVLPGQGTAAAGDPGIRSHGSFSGAAGRGRHGNGPDPAGDPAEEARSEEHTSELQSLRHLVCRLLLEMKKNYFGRLPM